MYSVKGFSQSTMHCSETSCLLLNSLVIKSCLSIFDSFRPHTLSTRLVAPRLFSSTVWVVPAKTKELSLAHFLVTINRFVHAVQTLSTKQIASSCELSLVLIQNNSYAICAQVVNIFKFFTNKAYSVLVHLSKQGNDM